MKKMTDQELRSTQISILKNLDDFCRSNDIIYSMAAGSLIGAVRHDGFIPWDDDIDVMMTRENYEKFLATYRDSRYRAVSPYTDRLYPYAFAKLIDTNTIMNEEMSEAYPYMGVYIDIFPFDERPDSCNFIGIRLLKMLQTIKTLYNDKSRSLIKRIALSIIQFILKPIRINSIVRLLDKKSKKWSGKGYNYSLILFSHDLHIIFTKDEMLDITDHKFENLTCKITKHYDSVLTKRFGDYMKLPPESERMAKHSFGVFFK